MSKSARKNAARRARTGTPDAVAQPASCTQDETARRDQSASTTAADEAAAQLQRIALVHGGQGAPQQPAEDDADALRRRLRALRKKVRLCLERVRAEEAKGGALSDELKARLANVVEWCAALVRMRVADNLTACVATLQACRVR